MKRYIIILLLFCVITLTGCEGGSLYSNYRELEQLTVIETMGFDSDLNGVKLSVSSGAGGSSGAAPSCLTAADKTITLARERIQHYSPSEQLFFAHTAFVVLGEQTARQSLSPYLDYIGRAPDLRLDVPLFIVNGGRADTLISGAGSSKTDATAVFKSLERDLENRGDCPVYSVSEIIAALDLNGCALAAAIRPVKASEVVKGSGGGELSAIPGGLSVIKNGQMIGTLDMDAAFGVSLITGGLGPASVVLDVNGSRATVTVDDCTCDIAPVFDGDALKGLSLKVTLHAALGELNGEAEDPELSTMLEKVIKNRVEAAMSASRELACDFMQLGTVLEIKEPYLLHGLSHTLSAKLPALYCGVTVSAEIDRGYDM